MRGSYKNLLPVLLCVCVLGSSLAEICVRPTLEDCKRRKCRRIDPDLCNEIGGIYLQRGDNCKKCPVCMKRVGLNETCNTFERSPVSGNTSSEMSEVRRKENPQVRITQLCHAPLFCSRIKRGKCVENCIFRKNAKRRKRRHKRKRMKTIKNNEANVPNQKIDENLDEKNKSLLNYSTEAVGSTTESTTSVKTTPHVNTQNFLLTRAQDTGKESKENSKDVTPLFVLTKSKANNARRKRADNTIAENASAIYAGEENASSVSSNESNAREVSSCSGNAPVSGKEGAAGQVSSCAANGFTANASAESSDEVSVTEKSTSTGRANAERVTAREENERNESDGKQIPERHTVQKNISISNWTYHDSFVLRQGKVHEKANQLNQSVPLK